jgi:hypothetical protein
LRYSSCAVWSTAFLDSGPWAGKTYRLFVDTHGGKSGSGRILSLSDTNIKEMGRVAYGSAFEVVRCESRVQACPAASDVETLAQAYAKEDQSIDILNNGVLRFDFVQTLIDICPLWVSAVDCQVTIPEHASFAVALTFGADMPPLERAHSVKVCLTGTLKSQVEIG